MREYLFQSAKWIGTGDRPGNEPKTAPSPFFRKEFVLKKKPSKGEVFFCGLGYSELYLNGKKVDDGVLQPVVSQYDRHAGYLRYDISPMLKKGRMCSAQSLATAGTIPAFRIPGISNMLRGAISPK